MVVKHDPTQSPAPVVRTSENLPITPRHYVRCIDASDTNGILVTGRIYEVAIEIEDAHTWRGVESGFVLGNYSTPVGEGLEKFIVWPYVWNPTRFVPVSPDDVKLEDNGHLITTAENE